MPGITLMIDPDAAPLAFVASEDGYGFHVLSPLKSIAAQSEKQWASNNDTEGELPAGGQSQNAQITPKLRITGATEKAFRERQAEFEEKYDKLDREGGVLRLVYPDGSHIDWPVRAITGGERLLDNRFLHSWHTEDEVTFVCAPFGEGEEELLGEYEFEGEAKRALECIVQVKKGSAPALARAEITSLDADIWDLPWGLESRRLSEGETAKNLYAATALTPLGGAVSTTATIEGKAGIPVVRQANLTPNWTGQVSTEISGVGQMTHEGIYEVLVWVAMPTTNTGEVGLAFEYGIGDAVHRVELEQVFFPVDHPREGKVIQVSLGQAFLRASGRGPHQWEGRILSRSTVTGDDLEILDFGLRPVGERSGRISISPSLNQPAALLTRDEFNQSAGNLNGKVIAAARAVSGPKSPGTCVDDAGVGTVAWSSPGSATASDNNRASVTVGEGDISHYLKATNFGFAIPVGATIDGIVVEIERRNADDEGQVADKRVRIVKGGTIQAAERAAAGDWPGTDTYKSYGSQNDLWGATWTVADINSVNFGVALAVRPIGSGGKALVDHIRITVYYLDAAGQTWATTGDAVDIAVEEAGHTAQRTEVSDSDINTGRYAIAGTTVTSDVVVGIKAKRGGMTSGASERVRGGSLAREVDTNNWLFFGADAEYPSVPITDTVRVVKRVAGTVTELGRLSIPPNYQSWRQFWLQVDRRGRYFCWGALQEGGIPRLLLVGQDNDLREGGPLDDGKNGFYDAKTGAIANTRNCDQFVVWIPPLDAVIYQNLSMELTDSACRREVQGGGEWTSLVPEGDYLKLEPARLEGRKNRLVFFPSPHDPNTMGVGFPGKLKIAIYGKPRHRTIPGPA